MQILLVSAPRMYSSLVMSWIIKIASVNFLILECYAKNSALLVYDNERGIDANIGARNIFDTQPPLVSDGYLGSLYVPYGRYLYARISKRF